MLQELNDPAARLFQAVQRYTDSLHVAAEQLVGRQSIAELDQADQHIPGLTAEPAWPALRARLLVLAAETATHPLRHLLTAAAGDLRTADDMAAVLDWRLTALTATEPGPLPWLAAPTPNTRPAPERASRTRPLTPVEAACVAGCGVDITIGLLVRWPATLLRLPMVADPFMHVLAER